MTDIIKHEGDGLEKKSMTNNEIAEARKKFLIQKYYQNEKNQVDLNKLIKFGVFKIDINQSEEYSKLKLIAKCSTQQEALEEIRWRAQFHHRPDNEYKCHHCTLV